MLIYRNQIKLYDVLITVHSIILCLNFYYFYSLLFLCKTNSSHGGEENVSKE